MNIKPRGEGLSLSFGKDDFRWDFFTAGGHGGQNVQKTATACRCVHPPSKASGISRDERSQIQNKRAAFRRCVESPEFKLWAKQELQRQEARAQDRVAESIESQVESDMSSQNIRVETHDEQGRWVEAK